MKLYNTMFWMLAVAGIFSFLMCGISAHVGNKHDAMWNLFWGILDTGMAYVYLNKIKVLEKEGKK